MAERIEFEGGDITRPAVKGVALTLASSGSASIAITRGLYVGGAGNVVCTMDGSSVTFSGVSAGTVLPIRVTGVSSSSSATSLVALY